MGNSQQKQQMQDQGGSSWIQNMCGCIGSTASSNQELNTQENQSQQTLKIEQQDVNLQKNYKQGQALQSSNKTSQFEFSDISSSRQHKKDDETDFNYQDQKHVYDQLEKKNGNHFVKEESKQSLNIESSPQDPNYIIDSNLQIHNQIIEEEQEGQDYSTKQKPDEEESNQKRESLVEHHENSTHYYNDHQQKKNQINSSNKNHKESNHHENNNRVSGSEQNAEFDDQSQSNQNQSMVDDLQQIENEQEDQQEGEENAQGYAINLEEETIKRSVSQLKPQNLEVVLIDECRVISKELYQLFENELSESQILQGATKNQLVYLFDNPTQMNYEEPDQVQDYLNQVGDHCKYTEQLTYMGHNQDNFLMKVQIRQPAELVAKMVMPEHIQQQEQIVRILTENHLMKILAHQDHVAQIKEEIIEFNSKDNKILNYMVIVEQADVDLLRIINIWANQEQSLLYQEYFSQEKLFYFCLKAAEALDYLHQNNVYYGDMKASNLNIFKDYSVKLGDFSTSIKLSQQYDENDAVYDLIGIATSNSTEYAQQAFQNNEKLSKNQLIQNDYFALCATFESICQILREYIDEESYFFQFLQELKTASIENVISGIIEKYQEAVQEDQEFICKLCDQLIQEEKFSAIPTIISLSKHQLLAQSVKQMMEAFEQDEFSFLKKKPMDQLSGEQEDGGNNKTEEDQENNQEKINRLAGIVKQYLIEQEEIFYSELAPLILRLIHFKSCLSNDLELYHFLFFDAFKFQANQIHFNELLSEENHQFLLEQGGDEIFISQFSQYIEFFILVEARDQQSYIPGFENLIAFVRSLNNIEFEAKLLYYFIKSIAAIPGFYQILDTQLKRLNEIYTDLNTPGSLLEEYLVTTLVYSLLSYAINYQNPQKEDLDAILETIQQYSVFDKVLHSSAKAIIHQAYSIKELSPGTSLRLDHLLQFRECYEKIYGRLGKAMSDNSYMLFEEYQKLNNDEGEYSELMNHYLEKAVIYSLKEQRVHYLLTLCELNKENQEYVKEWMDQNQDLQEALQQLL